MERFLEALKERPQVREPTYYNVPKKRKLSKKVPAALPASTPQPETVPNAPPQRVSAVDDMPDDFWQALTFFLGKSGLKPNEITRIETQFREVHRRRVGELSLENIEAILAELSLRGKAPAS